MADWNEIKHDIKKTAKGVGAELAKMGQNAATHLKLNGLKVELAELFEKLGRVSYENLRKKEDEAQDTEKIAALLSKIDEKKAQITALEADIASKKD